MAINYLRVLRILQGGRLRPGALVPLESAGDLVGGALLHAAGLLGALARGRVPEGAAAVRVVVEVPDEVNSCHSKQWLLISKINVTVKRSVTNDEHCTCLNLCQIPNFSVFFVVTVLQRAWLHTPKQVGGNRTQN